MKTQKFGRVRVFTRAERYDNGAAYIRYCVPAYSIVNSWEKWDKNEFRENRVNGIDADDPINLKKIPHNEFPNDGSFNKWITGEKKADGRVYGVKRHDGLYEYEADFIAGRKDLEWLSQKDANYLRRIFNDGTLREKEPAIWYLWEASGKRIDVGKFWQDLLVKCHYYDHAGDAEIQAVLQQAEINEKALGGKPFVDLSHQKALEEAKFAKDREEKERSAEKETTVKQASEKADQQQILKKEAVLSKINKDGKEGEKEKIVSSSASSSLPLAPELVVSSGLKMKDEMDDKEEKDDSTIAFVEKKQKEGEKRSELNLSQVVELLAKNQIATLPVASLRKVSDFDGKVEEVPSVSKTSNFSHVSSLTKDKLALISSRFIEIFDLRSNSIVSSIALQDARIQKGYNKTFAVLSPTLVAIGRYHSDGGIRSTIFIWDLLQSKCIGTLSYAAEIRALVALPGNLVAVGGYAGQDGGTIKIFNAISGECIKSWLAYSGLGDGANYGGVTALAYFEGRLISAGAHSGFGKIIKVWDIDSGKCINTIQTGVSCIYNLIVLADGKIIAIDAETNDSKIVIGKIDQSNCKKVKAKGRMIDNNHPAQLMGLGDKTFILATENAVDLWDTDGNVRELFSGRECSIGTLEKLTNGDLVISSEGGLQIIRRTREPISGNDLQSLLRTAVTNRSLKILDLHQTLIDDSFVPLLVEILRQKDSTITTIDLRQTKVSPEKAQMLYELIKERIPKVTIYHEALEKSIAEEASRKAALQKDSSPARKISEQKDDISTSITSVSVPASAHQRTKVASSEQQQQCEVKESSILKDGHSLSISPQTREEQFSVAQQELMMELAHERQQFEAKLLAQYKEQEQKISQEIAAVRSQLAGQKQQQDSLLLQRLSALEYEQKSLLEVRQKVDALQAGQTTFIQQNLERYQEIYRRMQELGQKFALNLKTRGEELRSEQKELAGEIAKIEQQLAAKTGDEKELQARLEALQREGERQIMDKLQLEMQHKFVEFSEETAEQRQKLQQQLVTDRQQLESKFEQDSQQHAIHEEKIKAQLSVLIDKDARYEELQQQLHELKASQDLLMKDYRAKQDLLAKQTYLYQIPQLRFFYRCVQLKLAEVFLAIKSLASGMIDIPVSKKTQVAQKVIEIIGGNIPLPGASLIAAVIGKGLGMKDEADAKRRIEQQSASVPTIADIETIAESTARELAYRYEEQLMQLTPEGAKMLGACALARIMCYMDDHFGDLATGAEPAQLQECMTKQLMASVFKVKLKQGFVGLVNKKIPTEHGQQDWTENGIFMGAGIIVKAAKEGDQDMYFSGKMKLHVTPTEVFVIDTKPEKYGYRLGTIEEAAGLGLKQTPGRVGVEVGKGIGLSRGANMQIMQVTKRTEDQEGQTEVLRIQLQQETDKRAQVEEKVLALEEELAKQREKQRQTDEKLAVLMKFMMQHQGASQPQATIPQSGAAATPSMKLNASSVQSSGGSAPSSSFFGSPSPTASSSSSSGFPPAQIEYAEHKDGPEPAAVIDVPSQHF